MDAKDVIQVLDALDGDGIRQWVGGGWGVAALAGRQTRQHRDLDLNIDATDLSRCLVVLGGLGYVAETDWLPSKIELRAPGDRWVDVHPVAFAEDGSGRQADLDGGFFEYPADAFARGLIAGRSVACLSARQQRVFHDLGYEHRPQDIHDLAQLDALPDQLWARSVMGPISYGPDQLWGPISYGQENPWKASGRRCRIGAGLFVAGVSGRPSGPPRHRR